MTDDTQPDVVVEETPEVPTEAPQAVPEADDSLPYTMGEWSGLPLWKCRYCLFATPDGEYALYTHLTRHLDTGELPERPPSGLVDPSGNPV